MRHWGYGRIINMGSVVAQKGVAGTSAYAASKAGLWGMTKAIAEENREKNITINTLNLGYMDGGMGRRIEAPLELGGIDSIINAIDFLVDSPFVTGTSIDINGGLI
jgi:NAD(P)-dependent dehydrogenase (short-subunit alcohol dehydrogenase family)